MRNFKKILFLVLCLALMLTFIACGNDENAITVKFDTQGGTQINDIVIEKGDNVPKPNDPEKVGYTFDGWYADGEEWSFVGYTVANDITLTAKWAPVEYTITFAGNVEIAPVKYTIEDAVTLPKDSAKIGYVLVGWFEDEELTKPISQIEKGSYGDKILYAKTTYTGIELTLKNDKYSVTNCDPNATEIVIPSTYNGKSVTSIDSCAFDHCYSLTSVTIPDSVTEIGYRAFEGCKSLTSVTIPDSVTSIYDYAFYGCTALTSVTIPNNITSLSEGLFVGCTSLTSVTIGNSVTEIGAAAFADCTSLASITIPNSVTEIGESAFRDCSSLTSITIEGHVTLVGYDAFSGCPIGTATIPSDATLYIPKEKLKTVVINSGVSIGDDFSGCPLLTSVTIPNSVTTICNYAFEGCSSLTSITIPNSVTSIGKSAFSYCTSLTSVTIPDSVTSIGSGAFSDCTSLTSIIIPSEVTKIEYNAFNNCPKLTIYCEATSRLLYWDSSWYSDMRHANAIYLFSESEPTESGNYWHYGTNGEIVVWE